METKGHSIWLLPDDKSARFFSDIISKFSKKFETPYFSPHVTLLGQLPNEEEEVLKKTEQICNESHKFSLELSKIHTSDNYFGAVTIGIKENAELIELRSRMKSVFAVSSEKDYSPHLSLLYGNVSDGQKQKMTSDLGDQLDNLEFEVQALGVVKTEGVVFDWKVLKNISLN